MKLKKGHYYSDGKKDWGYSVILEIFGWRLQLSRAACWRHCAHTPKFRWWHLVRFSPIMRIGNGGTRRLWVYPRFGLAFHLDADRIKSRA